MTVSVSVNIFTDSLLAKIWQQQHFVTQVVITTQESTISLSLLKLSSMAIVHCFTSSNWFMMLHNHLAGAHNDSISNQAAARMFEDIMKLRVSEALLFSSTAMLRGSITADVTCNNTKTTAKAGFMPMEKLGAEWIKIHIRKRITEDERRSSMAVH